jgi:poly(A) polymerase
MMTETEETRQTVSAEDAIEILREATRHSPYENQLYLVGGLLRDKALGLPISNDLDVMLEGDALALARYLYDQGISWHYPVEYPRFGTAMIHVGGHPGNEGCAVELVTARSERYHPDSRKPDIAPGTLEQDVFRRDFTINTLLENLHTGETLDLTGRALDDLRAGILRTPLEPQITFFDDPLRMLRAVRFAARFGFEIEPTTWAGICAEAERLRPPAISVERIREEFVKIVKLPGKKAGRGLRLLQEGRLLEQFLPEMLPMIGCTQGNWHRYDVWNHTLYAMEFLPDEARLEIRLGLLWHDVGKPATRTEEPDGHIRFYKHPSVGAEMTAAMMRRLKFSNDEIRDVTFLVEKHMRFSEYNACWTDASVRRLIRECGSYREDLFTLVRCDSAAVDIPPGEGVDLNALHARIEAVNAELNAAQIASPLDGFAIMKEFKVGAGKHIQAAKDYLTNEVIEGRLAPDDTEQARQLLRSWWENRPDAASR